MDARLRSAIIETSSSLGISPVDLATAMSYETGGTFDPWQKGPTTKWGTHRGLIQWGVPQRKRYGVYKGMPVEEQVRAAGRYLKDAGVKPGMGLLEVYSAINAGGVGDKYYSRSDAAAGGAPGTVRDKVEKQMGGHRKRAAMLLGEVDSLPLPEATSVSPMPAAIAAAGVPSATQPGALAFGQPETANTPPEAFNVLLAGGATEQKPVYEMPTRRGQKVLDPALLEQLNAPSPITEGNTRKKVEDPELLKALNAADNAEPAAAPSIREDMGRSVLSGIRQGVEGLAGLVGDVNKTQGSIVGWLSTKLGASPETAAKISEAARRTSFMPMAPTTEELRGGTTAVVGEPYQPQTVPGEYARTVGEFAPGMLIPGQGGLVARAANAIVPALTSETAGQLTKGTAAEPYARLAGGLAGGAAVAGSRAILDARAARNSLAPAPTADELRKTGNSLYESAKTAGVTVNQDAYGGLVKNVAREMKDFAFDKELQPRTATVLRRVLAAKDAELSLPELENLRKMASTVAREAADASDKRAAGMIVEQIDNFIDDAANFSANSDDALAALREARSVWKRKMKLEAVEEVFNKADLDTSKYTQSGLSQTVTNNFKTLAKNPRKMAMFTKAEQEMIREIVKGTPSEKVIRWLAKLAPRGVISAGTGAALGNLAAGPAGMFIGPAVGQGAAMMADRNAVRSVQTLSDAVSRGFVPQNSYPLQLAPIRNSLIMGLSNSNALSSVR